VTAPPRLGPVGDSRWDGIDPWRERSLIGRRARAEVDEQLWGVLRYFDRYRDLGEYQRNEAQRLIYALVAAQAHRGEPAVDTQLAIITSCARAWDTLSGETLCTPASGHLEALATWLLAMLPTPTFHGDGPDTNRHPEQAVLPSRGEGPKAR
jgi:hypothetical protein